MYRSIWNKIKLGIFVKNENFMILYIIYNSDRIRYFYREFVISDVKFWFPLLKPVSINLKKENVNRIGFIIKRNFWASNIKIKYP